MHTVAFKIASNIEVGILTKIELDKRLSNILLRSLPPFKVLHLYRVCYENFLSQCFVYKLDEVERTLQ